MAIPVEEALSLWRELERVRDELPTASPERQLVEEQIVEVRHLYARLTAGGYSAATRLRASRSTIAAARQAVRRAAAGSERVAARIDALPKSANRSL